MWSCVWLFALCAVYAAGETANDVIAITLDIGEKLHTTVTTWPNTEFSCNLETPSKKIIEFRPQNKGDPSKYDLKEPNVLVGCAVSVKITGPEDNGLWRLFFDDGNGNTKEQVYRVTVNGTQDDEEDQSEEVKDRQIEYLDAQVIHTSIGEVHRVTIRKFDFVHTESCHIISPDGVEHTSNEKDVKGLKWIEDVNEACAVEIHVVGENMVGNWTLFSREVRHSVAIEKRQPVTIHVEEYVEATPNEVTIAVGNNLHVRLANPTPRDLQNTCVLVGPRKHDTSFETDNNNADKCGFIIKDIQDSDKGTWNIIYGKNIIYKAPIEVTVTGGTEVLIPNLTWRVDEPVDMFVGPENAVYCNVRDPAFRTVFEGLGRCRITLDKATHRHNGNWQLTVGAPGRITTDEHRIHVTVLDAASRPTVITHVEKQQPEVLLACGLPGEHQVRTCKFRDPSGRVFLAPEGVGEDQFSSNGAYIGLESSVNTTSCGLRIKAPTSRELGLWRCAMETTDNQVYYGFLTVLCEWALMNPAVAASVVQEPTLTAYEPEIWAQEGEVTMSCSVQSAIKYCYFRSRNGTIFNVNPGMNANGMAYVGAGFEAGECGVRMTMRATDSGAWSCHVGLVDQSSEEQRANFAITVNPVFTATQSHDEPTLVLTGRVYDGSALDYCRYVRIDGAGFTEDNLPARYVSFSNLQRGSCELHISEPTILDHHPWTIAARVRGQHVEVSDSTDHTLVVPEPPVPEAVQNNSSRPYLWALFVLLSVIIALLGIMVSTKASRKWTSRKASSIRNSFRIKKTVINNEIRHTDSPPVYTA